MIKTNINICFKDDGISIKCASNYCEDGKMCPNIKKSVNRNVIILNDGEEISNKIISDESQNFMKITV